MSKKAVAWVYSLTREQVSPVERDVLMARAELASEKDYVSFASNETLAKMARTKRRYVIDCNKSLVKKKLMVRATIPRFKTETVWYYLGVGVTKLDIFTSVLQDTRPHPSLGVSLVSSRTPYSDKTKKKTKASVANATSANTNFFHKADKTKKESKPALHPTPTDKTPTSNWTKKSPLPPFGPAGASEDVFRLFWDAFPPSWKKRGKEKVRAHFFRLKVGMDWFEKRWVPALQQVNYQADGEPREVKYLISPHRFLVDRRWTDEN